MNNTVIKDKMTTLKTFLSAFLFLAFFTVSSAQSGTPSGLLASKDLTAKSIDTENWSFFYDEENKIYYIDFETISLNLTDIKVKQVGGNEVISDKVADLPVNTIYELDCSQLNDGEYTIELHSYTKVLTKNIKLK